VLDMFCYSGAFSLCASRLGGAREVIGVDTSDKAVALAKGNARLNEVTNCRFETSDAFTALDQLVGRREKFGAVFLDPPKFARSRQALGDAMQAYHRINRLGDDLLEPGGILVTSSCSGSGYWISCRNIAALQSSAPMWTWSRSAFRTPMNARPRCARDFG